MDTLAMPRVSDLLREAAARLSPVTDTPRLDAEILLAESLSISRSKLLASLDESVDPQTFETYVKRRESGEPVAYILGRWEFFSREFIVEPPLLVPRPETEHLVERVLDHCRQRAVSILEVGTGTGCVAVTLAAELPRARILATDIQPACLHVAQRNAQLHEVDARIEFMQTDLFQDVAGPFDVICSNPPYIADGDRDALPTTVRDFEDPVALFGGSDGLDTVRTLVASGRQLLRSGGLLAIEIGAGQSPSVRELLGCAGYTSIQFDRDLAGHERIASGRAP